MLIDMEPKVVQASLRRAKRSGRWRYDSARTLAFQSGSGNNWARGYNTYGPQTRETALELVRRETEACDHFGGFLLLQSMAGGTGAGLGAYVAEALRDDYAHAALLNHCVWPHESGEVIVQSYNTLLTASALLDVSDGVVVAQNDQLRLTCVKQLGIERPTFDDMNLVAAKQIAGVLLPSCRRDARASWGSMACCRAANMARQSALHRRPADGFRLEGDAGNTATSRTPTRGVTCSTGTFEKAIACASRTLHPARPAIDSRTRDHEARLFRAGRARARGGQARGGVVRACRPASPRSFFFDARSADRVRSGTSRAHPLARTRRRG